MNRQWREIVVTYLLLLAFWLTSCVPALAAPTPPGPNVIQWLFGGTVHYEQLGVTLLVEYLPPEELRQHLVVEVDPYLHQQGIKVPVGSILRLTAYVDTNQRPKDRGQIKTDILVGRPDQPGWVQVARQGDTWVKHTVDTAGFGAGIMAVQVYADTDHDQNNHQTQLIVLESLESVYRRLGVQTLQQGVANQQGTQPAWQTTTQPGQPTGTVKVVNNTTARPISVWVDGRQVAKQVVGGIYYFQGIPVGVVEIRIHGDDQAGWLLEPANDFLRDEQGRVLPRKQLGPDQTVEFRMRKGGGGR